MSSFAIKMCQALGIKQNASTAFHPRTDGQSELNNKKLEQFLQFYANADMLQDSLGHINVIPNNFMTYSGYVQ